MVKKVGLYNYDGKIEHMVIINRNQIYGSWDNKKDFKVTLTDVKAVTDAEIG